MTEIDLDLIEEAADRITKRRLGQEWYVISVNIRNDDVEITAGSLDRNLDDPNLFDYIFSITAKELSEEMEQ